MARKGTSKVRTGCLTCKIRKVKCDEGKPCCHRCVSTGRKCDGYVTATSSSSLEKRALQFFCQAAGPSLSGPMDPYFWTHLVIQFSTFEPAVRHSVVAISSLYEQMHTSPGSAHRLVDNRLALSHYNLAIRELKSMKNEPLVLLVCILFVCVEFLLGNQQAAVQHCKHGVSILENVEPSYPWAKQYLAPIFRRLTLFPFFFAPDERSFPKLLGLGDQLPTTFQSLEEAQYYLDGILPRTVSLVRRGDAYRLGDMRGSTVAPDLLSDQGSVRSFLDEWNFRFLEFQNRASSPKILDDTLCNIELRYGVARIWVETAFESDEIAYDQYLDRFRWMVSRAATLCSSKIAGSGGVTYAPKFIFEMGFVALLYYIVMKCRCLPTRLKALNLMKELGVSKESLWEASNMYSVGRRIIEIEHGLLLDEEDQPSTPPSWPGLPPDEMRIRDSTTDPTLTVQTDSMGQQMVRRMIGFFKRDSEGKIYVQKEFNREIAL
ncbi:hypothetical protein M426DRAFT_65764 [Hypoxylon sp. CI-4A]|nr:hypothetical protein M426DRAFT_65764 [Hypoxylon sp. CI-4A]